MWIAVDLIIIGVILLCTFIGYKRGLIGVIFKIISFFIAIIVALILSGPISNYIVENTKIPQNMENAIVQKFTNENIEEKEVQKEDINNTSQLVVDYINKQASEIKNAGIRSMAKEIVQTGIRITVTILLYFITRIVLFFFRKLAESLAEIPFIKQFNEAGGTIYGAVEGIVIVYVVLAILSLVAPIVSNNYIFKLINDSAIGSFIYNNNIILNLVLKG